MKLLCIGNSFSYDACTYMAKIAKAGNFDLTTYNLYIGGCSLERHCSNIGGSDDEHLYEMNINGDGQMRKISLEDALKLCDFDVISVQQASHYSGMWETYEPYLTELVRYVKKYQPRARIAVHETWAYEYNSAHEGFSNYDHTQAKMHERIVECCRRASELIGADLFIPSGELIAELRKHEEFDPQKGGIAITRDGFHMSLDYGRYAIGALWCVRLGMKDLLENTFRPFGEAVEEEKIALIKKSVKLFM